MTYFFSITSCLVLEIFIILYLIYCLLVSLGFNVRLFCKLFSCFCFLMKNSQLNRSLFLVFLISSKMICFLLLSCFVIRFQSISLILAQTLQMLLHRSLGRFFFIILKDFVNRFKIIGLWNLNRSSMDVLRLNKQLFFLRYSS